MMKKITLIVIIAVCLSFLLLPVMAANEGQGVHAGNAAGATGNNGQSPGNKGGVSGAGAGNAPVTLPPEASPGDQQGNRGNGNNPSGTPRNISEIPGPANQSGEGPGAALRNGSVLPPGWVKNPNQVRDTVHALLAMENRTGGIGPQVSAIAREFNNSANASLQLEDRITNRDAFSRFFFGSDRQAAAELANLTAANQARIVDIENLMNTTTLDPDTRSLLDAQLLLLQQNVAFDQQLAAQALQDRGIFGGLFG